MKVSVMITAEATVHLSKHVEMEQADFDKYTALCNQSGISSSSLDKEIAEIADKYGFGYGKDISDMDDLEGFEFELLKAREGE